MQPNVLLIILDAARRDAFEPYGAPTGSSPAVAQLAGRGAALGEVHATGGWTVPSHASMFTGLMPRAAGMGHVRSPIEARAAMESHRARLLPEVMRRGGYRTAAISANLWVSKASGFDLGFDEFVEVDSKRHARMHEAGRRERALWALEAVRGRADDGAAEVESLLARWSAAPSQPFFWFVNLLECHSPYLPPRPYGDASWLDRLRMAEDARRYYTLDGIWRVCGGATVLPDAALDRARRLYAGAIRYMDDWLARVLDGLDRAGVLDDTLVIVTSDHGENFGEGGLITHGLSLDERLLHVPFVAAGPGVPRELTSLGALPRHLAELGGVSGHPYAEDEMPPDGFAAAQFEPFADRSDTETIAALEAMGLADAVDAFTTPAEMAVVDRLKVVRRGDRELVYDLERDPLEEAPIDPGTLGGEQAEDLEALRAVVAHPAVGSREVARAPVTSESSEQMRELEERMKLLGYM